MKDKMLFFLLYCFQMYAFFLLGFSICLQPRDEPKLLPYPLRNIAPLVVAFEAVAVSESAYGL